jgi:hypothetical protein
MCCGLAPTFLNNTAVFCGWDHYVARNVELRIRENDAVTVYNEQLYTSFATALGAAQVGYFRTTLQRREVGSARAEKVKKSSNF